MKIMGISLVDGVRAMIVTFGTYGLKTLGEPLFTAEPAR
jgi:hypothetical protein